MGLNSIGNPVQIPVPPGARLSMSCIANSKLVQVVTLRFKERSIGRFSGTGNGVAMTPSFDQPVSTLRNNIVFVEFFFQDPNSGALMPARNINPPLNSHGIVTVMAEDQADDNNYSYFAMFVPD
jgi:hypothetical protein